MKMILTAVALTIASPSVVQADPGHTGHTTAPAAKDHKAKDANGTLACHMMNGKMMAMKDGKMVPCPDKQKKGKAAADPQAAHNMSSK